MMENTTYIVRTMRLALGKIEEKLNQLSINVEKTKEERG